MSNKLMLISNKLHSFRNFLPRLFHLRNIVHACNCSKNAYIRAQRCGSTALGVSSYVNFQF